MRPKPRSPIRCSTMCRCSGARGLLISITGGPDLTLYEVDEAASRIREEVDPDANIILGATYDPEMTGKIRVAVVATGTDATMVQALEPMKANTSRAPLAVTPTPGRADVPPPADRAATAVRGAGAAGSCRGDHTTISRPTRHIRRRRRHGRALHSVSLPGSTYRRADSARPSRRFRASTYLPMRNVPRVSGGCRAPRSFRLLPEGHWLPKNVMNPSRGMPVLCSSAWPQMWALACVRSQHPQPDGTRDRRPTMPPRGVP